MQIRNNIMAESAKYDLEVWNRPDWPQPESPPRREITHNLFHNNAMHHTRGEQAILGDPLFIRTPKTVDDDADFRLQEHSPARGTGVNTAPPRSGDTPKDIGAYGYGREASRAGVTREEDTEASPRRSNRSSRREFLAQTLRQLLDAGISVAALHYRLVSQAPLPAAQDDCQHTIQFLRTKANAWHIDKSRVGALGGSAGAQLCMYRAFHDEMADPDSDDLVERESARLTCVATNGGQTTMDAKWWMEHIPGYKTPHRDFCESFGVKLKRRWTLSVSNPT